MAKLLNMRPKIILFALTITLLTACRQNEYESIISDFYVPETVSSEAQEVIRSFKVSERYPWPAADDQEKWLAMWEDNERKWKAYNDSIVTLYNPSIIDTVLGGVPVLDIRPEGWKNNHKVLIYSHGGAYVLFSARSMLMGSVPVADRLNMRIISIDYTNAPRARSEEIIDQVIAVVKSMLDSGFSLNVRFFNGLCPLFSIATVKINVI
jgi:monoterpene epsilon-lactone hydrolase